MVLIAVSINNYKEKRDNEAYLEKTLLEIEQITNILSAKIGRLA